MNLIKSRKSVRTFSSLLRVISCQNSSVLNRLDSFQLLIYSRKYFFFFINSRPMVPIRPIRATCLLLLKRRASCRFNTIKSNRLAISSSFSAIGARFDKCEANVCKITFTNVFPSLTAGKFIHQFLIPYEQQNVDDRVWQSGDATHRYMSLPAYHHLHLIRRLSVGLKQSPV